MRAEAVYTVHEVQAGLRLNPSVWLGRTVLVRAEALYVDCGGCADFPPTGMGLRDPVVPGLLAPQPLALSTASGYLQPMAKRPLLTFFRRLPMLASLLSPAPQPQDPAIFRVRLAATNCPSAERHRCYKAVLLGNP